MADFELPTLQPDLENKEATERQDEASLQNELAEQDRLSDEMANPFDKNRVPAPGEGVGGRVVIDRDHWGE